MDCRRSRMKCSPSPTATKDAENSDHIADIEWPRPAFTLGLGPSHPPSQTDVPGKAGDTLVRLQLIEIWRPHKTRARRGNTSYLSKYLADSPRARPTLKST